MRQPPQPKRMGELLKLACTLTGDLPSPSHVTVYGTAQEISLGFPGTRGGIAALAEWADGGGGADGGGETATLSDGEAESGGACHSSTTTRTSTATPTSATRTSNPKPSSRRRAWGTAFPRPG